MQNDKMQTHLSVHQIHIWAIRHPSKNTKTSHLTLFLPTPKLEERFLCQEQSECSRIDWKIRPLNKNLKDGDVIFFTQRKTAISQRGCKRFARILHSGISNFPMSNN